MLCNTKAHSDPWSADSDRIGKVALHVSHNKTTPKLKNICIHGSAFPKEKTSRCSYSYKQIFRPTSTGQYQWAHGWRARIVGVWQCADAMSPYGWFDLNE